MAERKQFEELDAIARKAFQTNQQFEQTRFDAYKFARECHADPKYDAFRTSPEGREWRDQQFKRYGHRCPECNKIINRNNANIDHKYPRRFYPWLAWEIENLWVMCIDCNKAKGHLEWEDYLTKVKQQRGETAVKRVLKFAPQLEVETP